MSDASDVTSHFVHAPSCQAYKQIGRFGSKSGLHWALGDHQKCDCGCLDLLRRILRSYVLAEIRQFNNNDFEDAEKWERREKALAELLGESP